MHALSIQTIAIPISVIKTPKAYSDTDETRNNEGKIRTKKREKKRKLNAHRQAIAVKTVSGTQMINNTRHKKRTRIHFFSHMSFAHAS